MFLREGLDRLLVICPSGYFVAGMALTSSLRATRLGRRIRLLFLAETRITTTSYLSFRLIVRAQYQCGMRRNRTPGRQSQEKAGGVTPVGLFLG
jgi:hypothetical protein